MVDISSTSSQAGGSIPADDPNRTLTVIDPDAPQAPRISLVGDTYTILIPGSQTNGRYCLIDMIVPDGSGPPPHRHDFEEMFTLLEGELEFTFRGQTQTVKAPMSVNIPANAPHLFKNTSGKTVHMLCMCAPAGQDEFFMLVGLPVESRSAPPPPPLSKDEQMAMGKRAKELSARFRTEFLI